nr:zinc finger ccch domain-containing protein 1 [Quercus suber]
MKSWETLPPMKKPRKMCSSVFMDEKFYVIGGIGGPDSKVLFMLFQKKTIKPDNNLYFSTGSSKNTSSTAAKEESKKKPIFQFESSKEIQVEHDSRATVTLETETDFSRDARALGERSLKQAEEALKGKGKSSGDEKLYRGINGYTDYKAGFRREQRVASEKAGGAHGPLRASAHIRVSARFDYQPDICKDSKETGYCGYGDSCKFMHDRGDYKSGWQMEKEWDEAEKPFVDAVVTKCKHYFCKHCALKEEGLELYVDMVLGRAVYDVCTQMCHRGNMFGFLLLYNDEEAKRLS